MRNIYLLACSLFVIVISFSCNEKENYFIDLNVSSKDIDEVADTFSISTYSNEYWSVISADTWCRPAISKGNGELAINFYVAENYTGANRSTTLSFKSDNVIKRVTVNQKGGPLLKSVRQNIELSAITADSTIDLRTTETWKATSNQPWLVVKDSIGKGNKKITCVCDSNFSGINRKALVTISGGTFSTTVTIRQSGGRIIFEDDFNDNKYKWPERNDSLIFQLKKGSYQLKNVSQGYTIFSGVNLTNGFNGKYQIVFSSSIFNAPSSFGFLFGGNQNSGENMYFYFPNQKIVFSFSNQKTTYYKNITDNGFKRGGAKNVFRLLIINSRCQIFINDSKVASFPFSTIDSRPFLGFLVSSGLDAEIDYFKVTQLD